MPDPAGAEPVDFHVFGNNEGADGIEFNETGALYVASNLDTKVIVLDPDGSVARTVTNGAISGAATFDTSASVTFHDGSRS